MRISRCAVYIRIKCRKSLSVRRRKPCLVSMALLVHQVSRTPSQCKGYEAQPTWPFNVLCVWHPETSECWKVHSIMNIFGTLPFNRRRFLRKILICGLKSLPFIWRKEWWMSNDFAMKFFFNKEIYKFTNYDTAGYGHCRTGTQPLDTCACSLDPH